MAGTDLSQLMGNKNDFSKELTPIAAPVSANGDLLVQAGRTAGAAATKAGEAAGAKKVADANLFSFLGTQAAGAYKGKLEADEEKAITGILSKLDTVADTDINANNQKLAGQFLESAASDDFMGGQTVKAFTDEARRYAEARRQGVIGREEALAQIGAAVKKYSAMLPGSASDFRKIGAQLTGIPHVDVYGIHHALTTQSEKEKMALKNQEADLQLRKEAATALGLPSLDKLTDDALEFYRQTKMLGLRTQNAENVKKNEDIQQGDVDKVNTQIASGYIASGVSGLASEFAQLHAAHLSSDNPVKQEDALRLGGQLAAKLDVLEAQLVGKINSLTTGKNPMSRDNADKIVTSMRQNFQGWKEAVKTAEGFNFWNQTVRAAKGNVEYIVNSTMLAAPHLAVLKELGIMPDLAKAYMTLTPKDFEQRFGKDATAALESAMKEPKAYANGYRRVANGQSTLADEAARDPNLGKVLYNDVTLRLEQITKDGSVLRNEQKAPFSNFLAAFTTQMNHANPGELKKFQELMFNPNMRTLIDQLDPIQRSNALAPLFAKVDSTLPEAVKDIKTKVDSYNNLEVNQAQGHKTKVVFDAVAQTFRLDVQGRTGIFLDKTPLNSDLIERPSSGFTSGPRYLPQQRELLEGIQRQLDWVNTVPHVVGSTLPLVSPDRKGLDATSMFQKIDEGIKAGTMSPMMREVVVPKNTNQAASLKDEHIVQAIVAAERSDVNSGESPKGALGPMQLMPDTARELGLTVDAAKGIDERTDMAKAAPAAIKYIRQHLSDFGGDVAKAAAAYNAGPKNVKKAVAAAKEAGSPDEWVYFLPKPSETGPYIKRFTQALQ